MINRMIAHARCRSLALAAFGIVLAGWSRCPAPANARVWVGFGFPFVRRPAGLLSATRLLLPAAGLLSAAGLLRRTAGCHRTGLCRAAAWHIRGPARSTRHPASPASTGGAVCPMEHPAASGSSCYCTTAQGRVWGRAT